MIHAAGTMLRAPTGEVLFVKRSGSGDQAGTWALPGGGIERGESALEAAQRENREELGPHDQTAEPQQIHSHEHNGVDFTTFHQDVPEQFAPALNEEHTEHAWAHPKSPPAPLHPGVAKTLDDLNADEEARFVSHAGDFEIIQPENPKPAPPPDEEEIDEADVQPTYELEISE